MLRKTYVAAGASVFVLLLAFACGTESSKPAAQARYYDYVTAGPTPQTNPYVTQNHQDEVDCISPQDLSKLRPSREVEKPSWLGAPSYGFEITRDVFGNVESRQCHRLELVSTDSRANRHFSKAEAVHNSLCEPVTHCREESSWEPGRKVLIKTYTLFERSNGSTKIEYRDAEPEYVSVCPSPKY